MYKLEIGKEPKIACPECGHIIGTMSEKWECRNCPHCGLLVFKE